MFSLKNYLCSSALISVHLCSHLSPQIIRVNSRRLVDKWFSLKNHLCSSALISVHLCSKGFIQILFA